MQRIWARGRKRGMRVVLGRRHLEGEARHQRCAVTVATVVTTATILVVAAVVAVASALTVVVARCDL